MSSSRFFKSALAGLVATLFTIASKNVTAQPTSIDTIAKYRSAVSFAGDTVKVNGQPILLFSINALPHEISTATHNLYNFRNHRVGYLSGYHAGDTLVNAIFPTDKGGGSFYVLPNADSISIMRDFVCYNLSHGWYREAYLSGSVVPSRKVVKK